MPRPSHRNEHERFPHGPRNLNGDDIPIIDSRSLSDKDKRKRRSVVVSDRKVSLFPRYYRSTTHLTVLKYSLHLLMKHVFGITTLHALHEASADERSLHGNTNFTGEECRCRSEWHLRSYFRGRFGIHPGHKSRSGHRLQRKNQRGSRLRNLFTNARWRWDLLWEQNLQQQRTRLTCQFCIFQVSAYSSFSWPCQQWWQPSSPVLCSTATSSRRRLNVWLNRGAGSTKETALLLQTAGQIGWQWGCFVPECNRLVSRTQGPQLKIIVMTVDVRSYFKDSLNFCFFSCYCCSWAGQSRIG